jgi:hypothetical protein
MAQAPRELVPQNRLAVSGAEIILLILVVLGIVLWVWRERAFIARYPEPTEQQFLNTQSINDKQKQLTRLEAVREEAANQVVAAELDQLKQRAIIKSLETLHPGIGKLQQGTAVSAEAVKSYEAARAQELAASELIDLLHARIEKATSDAERLAQELDPQKQSARKEFKLAQTTYLVKKSAALFLFPLVIIIVLFFVVPGLVNLVSSGKVWTAQGSILFFVVVCALLILFAYEAFQLTGAVLMGVILFVFLLRRSKWPQDAKAK